ncbi:MAG: bifunctional riboflavin kinase/FAD synthetase [Acidobacteria bacterium]|nr:bifunctional riboflavin kinase/FAD synthetase [Acidobacteriota bacterium]
MEIIRYPDDPRPASWRSPVLALGNFDGLHRGHMTIVNRVVQAAHDRDATPVLLTFDPHPKRITRSAEAPRLLMTTAGKIEALEHSGLTGVAIVRFTYELSQWTPETFVEAVLVGWLGISEVWVGTNFLFGHDRTGDVSTLQALGRQYGFEAGKIDSVLHNGTIVSSGRIRALVAGGQVDEAAELLGHRHYIDGIVVRGAGRGREIGFPTANLDTDNELLPKRGVYATTALVHGRVWPSVTNIGRHPTFGEAEAQLVEVHLLDGGRDLYGEPVRLSFVQRLRDEQAFASTEALQAQISADCERARALVNLISV